MPKDLDAQPLQRRAEGGTPTPLRAIPSSNSTSEARTPAAPETPAAAKPAAKKGGVRRIFLGLLATAAVAAAAWYGHNYWTNGRFLVSTDDAYVEADFAVMSPKMTGYVASVPAVANQAVKAGDPLVVMEDGDYRNALTAAEAQFRTQEATIARIERQVKAAEAGVQQARSRVASAVAVHDQAAADLARYTRLASNDVASAQRLEAARASEATAAASIEEAKAGVTSAEANLDVVRAEVTEASAVLPGLAAARDRAQRDLDSMILRAPTDGVVGNLSVAAGDYVTPGKRLLAVVPLDAVYVDANFKETQIEKLVPGTKVTLSVDAFPDREITGVVEGVAPASGAVFSLLPPENATGNFTKVVQRLPVRIAVPADVAAEGWLRPGLSVTVTADPRTAPQHGAS